MAMPQQPASQPQSSKSNFWLIVIIILVVGAILWPILRRGAPAETETPTDGAATTSVSFDDEIIDDEIGTAVVNVEPVIQTQTASVASATADVDKMMSLRVYFSNRNLDPQGEKCEVVYPALRTVSRTTAVGRVALTELLKGPTPAEVASGVFTSINPGVRLQGLTIENGVARADFNQALGVEVGGACLTSAIRAQITETLVQFPTVKSVVISINGVSTGILQP